MVVNYNPTCIFQTNKSVGIIAEGKGEFDKGANTMSEVSLSRSPSSLRWPTAMCVIGQEQRLSHLLPLLERIYPAAPHSKCKSMEQ
jgi:hypothetical protein